MTASKRVWAVHEVETTVDFCAGNVPLTWVLGGLNYQIEHHLFPSMPRPNLRRAQPLVAAFCADLGVAYLETRVLASYGQVLGHLSDVGSGLAGPPAARKAVPVPARH